jgi:hypothetical protein
MVGCKFFDKWKKILWKMEECEKWKMTQIFRQIEDNLIILEMEDDLNFNAKNMST